MQKSDLKQLLDYQKHYVMGTYPPTETMITRGSMARVWDQNGKEYLDFTSGISVCNLGHCHPRVTEAIQRQAATLVHVSNLFMNPQQPQLAAHIAQQSFHGRVFFCNSGAEANEGLIKFARRWGNNQGKYNIICMDGSFHGRTLATLAATGRQKYREGFQPDVEGFKHVPFNSIDAVQNAIDEQTAAVLLEPIQGEGGVVPADPEFLRALRKICDENEILLLFDEVQCGMGRTGSFFAHQRYGVEPDGMSMAKALGNGFPIGAFEVRQEHADVLPPGTHASTFGGTPLACAAGVAVFETILEEDILENCSRMAAALWDRLTELEQRYECIEEVRGMGLMIGIQLNCAATDILAGARDKGLLALPAGENVLRLLPPLTIELADVEEAVGILEQLMR